MKKMACIALTKDYLILYVFGLTLFLFSVASVSHAKNVTLTWDPSQEAEVAGYKVYYGTKSSTYTGSEFVEGPSPIDIGIATNASFVGLDDTTSHYFAVTAYNSKGEESAYSV